MLLYRLRTRSGIRIQSPSASRIPLYVWRKIATYLTLAVLSFSWPRTRFYLVRVAASLGELRGFLDKAAVKPASRAPRRRHRVQWAAVSATVGYRGPR